MLLATLKRTALKNEAFRPFARIQTTKLKKWQNGITAIKTNVSMTSKFDTGYRETLVLSFTQ